MIEPYFAVWKKTRDAWSKEEPLGSLRSGWKNTSGFEKLAFSLFVTYGAVMLILAVAFAFNRALLPAYCIGYAVFLLLYAGMKRVIVARDRRIPAWKLNVHAPLIEQLRSEFKGVGLVNYEQVRIVKEEAVRLLARKEHRHESIVHTAIEICILTALVLMLNFVMTMLEHDASLEVVGILAVAAVLLAISAVFLVHAVWTACDRLGALPTPKLRLFVSDLDDLLVEELRRSFPVRSRPRRKRRTMQH
ncbi:hypothetical protein [Eggerthella sinensis]|uniref:hypothetical protein n=1 Tax=Eggerthella sinensis TaxID=242230 RepID=UPI0022E44067|nr:hypothetical protein [Eggerthella sinensis]